MLVLRFREILFIRQPNMLRWIRTSSFPDEPGVRRGNRGACSAPDERQSNAVDRRKLRTIAKRNWAPAVAGEGKYFLHHIQSPHP